MGRGRLGQHAKSAVKGKFQKADGAVPAGSSHSEFGRVVHAFYDAAGDLRLGPEIVEEQLAMAA
jgi:hypothetical protein